MRILLAASVLLAFLGSLAAPVLAGDAKAGAETYKTEKCTMCHQIAGQGGRMGGSLDGVGSKRDADWLKRCIKNPKSLDPAAKMKAYPNISDKDLDDLVAYLLTLKEEPKK